MGKNSYTMFNLNKLKSILFLCFFIISTIQAAKANVAFPDPITFNQPDGSSLTLTLKGDEKIRWAETEDGYSLMYNNAGYMCYAYLDNNGNMQPSKYIATDINKRSSAVNKFLSTISKGIFYSESQVKHLLSIWDVTNHFTTGHGGTKNNPSLLADIPPSKSPQTGIRRMLVILMGFQDRAFTKTQSEVDALFNQVGYTTDGAVGSVRDFYYACSDGQLTVQATVVGPFTADSNMAYYGGNDADGNDSHPRELVKEAVLAADSLVNFDLYDNDNDGYVDALYILYAGYDESAGAGADFIWAHKWALYPPVKLDNKYIYIYSSSSELRGKNGTGLTRIGAICHEFGHALGAPDFYDVDYSVNGQFPGNGKYDVMASGSWNGGDGKCPPFHNPFTRSVIYEWSELNLLDTHKTVTLMPNDTSSFHIILPDSSNENEFYLLENRQQTGFNEYIPGHGMIIYHGDIDSIDNHMYYNDLNAQFPQLFYVVCANSPTVVPNSTPSSYGSINAASSTFPGTGNKTEFSDTTAPSMRTYGNQNANKPITNITENSNTKVVTFDFMGGDPPTVITNNATNLTYYSATLNSDITEGANPITNKGYAWKQSDSTNWNYVNITNSNNNAVTISDLLDDTQYEYKAFAVALSDTTFGNLITFKTLKKFIITTSYAGLGTITPDSVVVSEGDNAEFNFTPDEGYHIRYAMIDSRNIGKETSYTFTNIKDNHTVYVEFAIDTFTVEASYNNGGEVTPNGISKVCFGDSLTYTFTPNTGYHIRNIEVDNKKIKVADSYTFTNIKDNHTITVEFAIDTFTVKATYGENGKITPNGTTKVCYGDSITYSIIPNKGYHIKDVKVDDNSIDIIDSYTFTNVTTNHTIYAEFAIDTLIIVSSAEGNGTISPLGTSKVLYGDSLVCNIIPDSGYKVINVFVDGENIGAVDKYIFTDVNEDHTIFAEFILDLFTIDASSSPYGVINPAGTFPVTYLDTLTFTMKAYPGCHIEGVYVNGVDKGVINTYTFTNVVKNSTIYVRCVVDTFSIEADCSEGGVINPTGNSYYPYDASARYIFTPNVGYKIKEVYVDNESIGFAYSYDFNNITKNHSIYVVFEADTFEITAEASDGGTITPDGLTKAIYTDKITYTFAANPIYELADVIVDGESQGIIDSYTFKQIDKNHTIYAFFAQKEIPYYTITASCNAGGTITPDGTSHVMHGDSIAYTIVPNSGCEIVDVLVDAESIGIVENYTFRNVTADHSIEVVFKEKDIMPASKVVVDSDVTYEDEVVLHLEKVQGTYPIKSYNVYVSNDNKNYNLLEENTAEISITFAGEIGLTYYFYSIATDEKGNVEENKNTFDSKITFDFKVEIAQESKTTLVCDDSRGIFVKYQWYKNDQIIDGAVDRIYVDSTGLNGFYYVEASIQNGKTNKSNVIKIIDDNIFDNRISSIITGYPNPAANTFNINTTLDAPCSDIQLYVIDMSGCRVIELNNLCSENREFNYILNLSNISSGVYNVVLFANEKYYTARLVIER